MSYTVDAWDNEYARLNRAAAQLRTTGHSSTMSDHRALSTGLQRLDRDLNGLGLPQSEIQRRRRLVLQMQPSAGTNNSALTQQDEMIDELAVGVGRLKQQTMLIGEEAKLHLGLLGEMETNVDAARLGLEGETRRAEQLTQDKSVWKLQLIIAGLSVLLVLLIITGLT
jgi:hypothetical protein